MAQIKFTVPDEVEEAFRKQAMETFGHMRGSPGKAGEQALRQWAEQMADVNAQVVFPQDPVDAIDGMLEHVDADSVELQEEVGRMKYEQYRTNRATADDDS